MLVLMFHDNSQNDIMTTNPPGIQKALAIFFLNYVLLNSIFLLVSQNNTLTSLRSKINSAIDFKTQYDGEFSNMKM